MPYPMDRHTYAALYGPTSGDRVRLADTNLFARIERDDALPGNELRFGMGRPLRDGMLISRRPGPSQLDVVITGALVMDPVLGIFKSDIGIKDGRIVAIGRAGNPDTTDGVDLAIGGGTGFIGGYGLIATPGGVDSHVHLITTSLLPAAITSGLTSLVVQGSGGVGDLGVHPETNMRRLLQAFEAVPINIAMLGRGSASREQVTEHIELGCAGLKIHEDLGAYPAVVDTCLSVADDTGVQVAIHTDGLQETMALSETIAAIDGRSIHAFHVEGSGGGHAPNLIEIVSVPNVLGSSTNPTIPYSVNSLAEQLDMIITVHGLSPLFETDMAAARGRVRASTIAAESVLHDMGAISIMSSDSQGMGRIGQVISRTWQLAHRMKEVRGDGFDPASGDGDDNARILRYLAKYTLNPAIAHGLDREVGSLEPGKLADIVLWQPAFFGVKPAAIIKGGFVAWGPVGDGDGSTAAAQPLIYRPMWGALGQTPADLAVNFISRAAYDGGFARRFLVQRRALPIRDTRATFKASMRHNDSVPAVAVDPETFEVSIGGETVSLAPAESLPLTTRYFVA
jgi:urease subunit alpha